MESWEGEMRAREIEDSEYQRLFAININNCGLETFFQSNDYRNDSDVKIEVVITLENIYSPVVPAD